MYCHDQTRLQGLRDVQNVGQRQTPRDTLQDIPRIVEILPRDTHLVFVFPTLFPAIHPATTFDSGKTAREQESEICAT